MPHQARALWTKAAFFAGLILSASGFLSPPVALAIGLIFGLSLVHPYRAQTRGLTKILLQASVVCLGFGMNLHDVLRAGKSGFIYTAIGIAFALSLGWLLGKILRVKSIPSFLIAAGTAICGGSAIAAVAPVVDANDEEMAVAMGTVFVLNSVALLIFPAIGHALSLTQTQFGLWGALAIHDTSSVVGACAKYGPRALEVGTVVKLARALWIVPITIAAVALRRDKRANGNKVKIRWPWFILLFCAAALLATYAPLQFRLYPALSTIGRVGLIATLFLIGTDISRDTLKSVGARPMLQGLILWIIVACLSLEAIRIGWIKL
jgi:uncharacterized integral membrane protein (TIGR00698 family)